MSSPNALRGKLSSRSPGAPPPPRAGRWADRGSALMQDLFGRSEQPDVADGGDDDRERDDPDAVVPRAAVEDDGPQDSADHGEHDGEHVADGDHRRARRPRGVTHAPTLSAPAGPS